MSRFYASIQGNRGMATRMGSEKSGMEGHIRGWGIGAYVALHVNTETGEDEISVHITGGSRNPSVLKRLGSFKIFNGEPVKIGGGKIR
jgi:hypothetical protein